MKNKTTFYVADSFYTVTEVDKNPLVSKDKVKKITRLKIDPVLLFYNKKDQLIARWEFSDNSICDQVWRNLKHHLT